MTKTVRQRQRDRELRDLNPIGSNGREPNDHEEEKKVVAWLRKQEREEGQADE